MSLWNYSIYESVDHEIKEKSSVKIFARATKIVVLKYLLAQQK